MTAIHRTAVCLDLDHKCGRQVPRITAPVRCFDVAGAEGLSMQLKVQLRSGLNLLSTSI
jgi:hypothetical protein